MYSYPRRWRNSTNNRTSVTLPDFEDAYGDVIHKMYLFIYIYHTPNDFKLFKVGDYVLCHGSRFSFNLKQFKCCCEINVLYIDVLRSSLLYINVLDHPYCSLVF